MSEPMTQALACPEEHEWLNHTQYAFTKRFNHEAVILSQPFWSGVRKDWAIEYMEGGVRTSGFCRDLKPEPTPEPDELTTLRVDNERLKQELNEAHAGIKRLAGVVADLMIQREVAEERIEAIFGALKQAAEWLPLQDLDRLVGLIGQAVEFPSSPDPSKNLSSLSGASAPLSPAAAEGQGEHS